MRAFRLIATLFVKEFIQIRRDPISLGMLLVLPAFLLILFGYALTFDVRHLAIGVCDQDRSAASRELIRRFNLTEYFDLAVQADDPRELTRLIDQEAIRVGLVIPSDFEKRLQAGQAAPVQLLIDGTNATIASAVTGYAEAIIQAFSRQVLLERALHYGQRLPAFAVSVEARIWYNPELQSARFLVPGLIAFLLMVTTVIATSLSVTRERERGTMEQLVLAPLKPYQLVLGKTLPYLLVAIGATGLILLVSQILFNVSVRGTPAVLALVVVLYLLAGLGQGLLISTIASSQQVAFQIAILSTLLPTFILSGFVFPIYNMPPVIQAITYLVPARYFLTALRGVMLKGTGLAVFWPEVLLLLAFAVLTLTLSSLRLRRLFHHLL
ncbi:ABC transporter permease [Rhodothermus bifroesti]|uniref:Transport permease protein n=1 Tax=Rhodothermus marinus TaxID=29549 RepID=A0A7V2AZA2_RHOMR|nr:ABC transporter permease [Rhodothermus bifroesti]GBD01784.1 Inner membrane transport permease YbhS [bacterium HR18]